MDVVWQRLGEKPREERREERERKQEELAEKARP
jgi:hypothetical protein